MLQQSPLGIGTPNYFIECYLMAEENLETCILRENENILYLQGLPQEQQQSSQ